MPLDDILNRHEYLQKPVYCYVVLVKGSGFERCEEKVLNFFDRYQLVRFSAIRVLRDSSLSAADRSFRECLDEAVRKNRGILRTLIGELQAENVTTLEDLNSLGQGYRTKLLHVVTHFLDGFFGIDTYFYNLVEDSHWVSQTLYAAIKAAPSDFWLISLEARI